MNKLTHVDSQNRPRMVNVGAKPATRRIARARALVDLPPPVLAALKDGELHGKKGPVFATAIIAGTMAAKKTAELIPFCHPLGLDDCHITITERKGQGVAIDCTCELTAKTGVEMEALTGATVAALTVYDMCKALSHDIVIRDVRLMAKSGGKREFSRK